MPRLHSTAPAKINLFLHVGSRRADGYHEIESLAAFADLGDELTLKPGGALSLEVGGAFREAAGPDENNLVLKAARALRAHIPEIKDGAFLLEKNLPAGAGIGGGSSDAAAALRLLAQAASIRQDDARLHAAAEKVGADVAVCLEGKARMISGIGEQLSTPLAIPPLAAVLVYPGVPASTPSVYRAFDAKGAISTPLGMKGGDIPLARREFIEFLKRQKNDLSSAAWSVTPEIAEAEAALRALDHALLIRMSGSGSTVFAIHETMAQADAEAAMIREKYPHWWVRVVTLR